MQNKNEIIDNIVHKIDILNISIDSEYAKKHKTIKNYYIGKKRGLMYALDLILGDGLFE